MFWFNVMSMTLARDQRRVRQTFPVEVLRSLLPMAVAGLRSTQVRTRQNTYRFLVGGNLLGEMCRLEKKEFIKLQKALEATREKFEADAFDPNANRMDQIRGLGPFVDDMQLQSAIPYFSILTTDNAIEWVFLDATGKRVLLGQEELFTETDLKRLDMFAAARVALRPHTRLTSRMTENPTD